MGIRIFSTVKTIEDITNWSEEQRASVRYARTEEINGEERLFAVYPKGTEVFGRQAEQLLAAGKAKVIDDTPQPEPEEPGEPE